MLDQAFFDGHRAAGQKEVMQVGWLYRHAVDLDELNGFHHNLSHGLLGRRIERSPLPFGRHRWVVDDQPTEIELAAAARPRAELGDWFDECTREPVDPERGPGWRLSVLPLTDGSTAISLVLSHYVIDGIGGALAVTEAALNLPRHLDYPPPRSRGRVRALIQDSAACLHDTGPVARAFAVAVRGARGRVDDVARAKASRPAGQDGNPHDPITMPSVWIRINLDEWSARAEALGGTASTLAAAVTARLDQHMGRRHGDCDGVPVLLVVNDRTADDVRAIAVSFVRARLDPTGVTADLRGARAAIKQALQTHRDSPDESAELAALTPFTPKQAWRLMVESALSDPEYPAVCSNLGDTGPAAIRPDGSRCDDVFARGASQHLTRHWLDRMGSQLHLFIGTSAEINRVGIYVSGYQPGSVTTRAELRALAACTLAEFSLVADID
ncbi:hypothetical protein [Mycolicibacterium anyangense]|uniref:hypothetical protein n=1 Tax=Mycolicibacterium anyangense TaxID=1431246 RepID=UPI0013D092FC|nr:hypothetical protein [Mycolicibacterium anyangense]